jgi:hypothetical protein
MLGLGKDDAPIGARAKIEQAKKMQASGRFNINQSGGGSTHYPSQTVPITLIYVLATLLSMMFTEGKSNPFSGMHITGYPLIDNFVTGNDIHRFTGDPDMDKAFTIMVRGLSFFVVAGIVPLLGFLAEKFFMKGKVQPFVICWGVITIIMMFYFFADDIVEFSKMIGSMVHS